jgi:hypothetical protein
MIRKVKNRKQELYDNGRHELINGNLRISVVLLTQVSESDPIYKSVPPLIQLRRELKFTIFR